jgi:hypothetical protein
MRRAPAGARRASPPAMPGCPGRRAAAQRRRPRGRPRAPRPRSAPTRGRPRGRPTAAPARRSRLRASARPPCAPLRTAAVGRIVRLRQRPCAPSGILCLVPAGVGRPADGRPQRGCGPGWSKLLQGTRVAAAAACDPLFWPRGSCVPGHAQDEEGFVQWLRAGLCSAPHQAPAPAGRVAWRPRPDRRSGPLRREGVWGWLLQAARDRARQLTLVQHGPAGQQLGPLGGPNRP